MAAEVTEIVSQMDRLYEYDREPVAESKLQSSGRFAGLFAGEHVAATEFVIGAFFVLHGVRAADLFLGLLMGNALAVLSWTFVCAPIAVRTRLTLYWYLRPILGPGLTAAYNVLNALLFCVLAGAMISVSSTAVCSVAGLATPAPTDVWPASLSWIVVTFTIGVLFTVLAILGFEGLSRFASVCSPWLFVIFVAGAVGVMPRLGVNPDFGNFWHVAETRIWNGIPSPGQEPFGVWHIVFFAWFANLAMHIGLSDMALFRYARSWKYGLWSACGMYPGHMLAWICSGIMMAAINREVNPGLMAYACAGLAGAIAVMIAGWTTANPTLYRAGLALQSVTRNTPRWKVTAAAGLATAAIACFPVVFLKLLDYVAIYGLTLMPVGAIAFAEHWILPRLGAEPEPARRRGWMVNPLALAVWAGTLLFCYWLPLHLFFKWLPGYLAATAAYCGLRLLERRTRA
jgi:cytosine permease